MKLAFSTLGCPDYSWPEIYSMAKDLGFSGIEMRGVEDERFSISSKLFTPENVGQTLKTLREKKLEIPCLSSGCALKYAGRRRETVKELRAYIELASRLETPFIRVLGDRYAGPEGDEVDDSLVLSILEELIPFAEEKNVTLLVETNGVYADTKRLADLLSGIRSENVGALWDIHHPFRFMGESPETTVTNLGAYIKYTHIKDSVMEDGKVRYRLIGEGDLPIAEAMSALRSVNYEGYVSLEWVRSYTPDLENAGIVFPHFTNYMARYFEGMVDEGSRLYDDDRHEGKYVWPKNHLIDLTFPQLLD
ncbi:MAG: sugar phosphate isomerase/epimerase, partial [Clostridia bacterium]|nr:sugar phosphate isomerase/epimerase [Clostridia bacterium]